MILYELFYQKITYNAFRKIYNDLTYLEIIPTVDPYPYNFEFGCQFIAGKLTCSEVEELRELYSKGVYWRDAYEKYSNIITNEWSFWGIYNGL